jgi:branched-chain amino acid transport system permease protein
VPALRADRSHHRLSGVANLLPSGVAATTERLRPYLRTAYLAPIGIAGFTVWAIGAAHWRVSYVVALAITGIGPGAIAALSGMGLVLTYRATGVFNFAQGAIATFCGYVYWDLADGHGWPKYLAALLAVLVVGPAVGLIADVLVFRQLQRRQASTAEKLVASLGLTVLFLGICIFGWGLQARFPTDVLPFGNHTPLEPFGQKYQFTFDMIGQVSILVIASIALTALFRYSRLGTEIRAVVDKRDLAELAAVNANRVSALSWAIGCGFAGLVGVLYAGSVALDPYRTTLLVIDTFAIAVIARLRNLPTAVIAGIVLGVMQAMIGAFHITGPLAGPVQSDILAMALPVFLILYRNLDEIGSGVASATRGLVTARFGAQRQATPPQIIGGLALVILVACYPFVFNGTNALLNGQKILALTVIFLSITAITGFSGHISLGQAGFAGWGAVIVAKASTGNLFFLPKIPVLLAILLAGVLTVPLGIVTGYPALRRRGLILALFTISMGVLVDTLLFQQDSLLTGIAFIHRPEIFGLSLKSDRAYFWFELVVVAFAFALTRNLREGRLGRLLGAMRDSETGATSVGISLRKYKLFIFATSAFLAAIGGALLMMSESAFNEQEFSPLYSLFYFTAVVVAGLSYLSGAPIAAFLFVIFDAMFNRDGVSQGVIGALALLIAFLPGGLVGTAIRFLREGAVPRGLYARYAAARDRQLEQEPDPEAFADLPVASPLAHDVLTKAGR